MNPFRFTAYGNLGDVLLDADSSELGFNLYSKVCLRGHFLSAGSCLPCTAPCIECVDNTNKCTNCDISANRILINDSCSCT